MASDRAQGKLFADERVSGQWLTLVGIGFSSLVGGYISDNFGRKKALIAALITFGIFTAALSVVPNFACFLMLRFLAGVGLGSVWSVVSAYIVETWPVESRGRAAAFVISAFPAGGAVAALVSGYFLPDWRLMFLVAGIAVLLPVSIILFTFKESATWAEQKAQHASNTVVVRDVFAWPLRRTTILGTLMVAFALTGYWGAMTWLPTYLAVERGLSSSSVAYFVTILNIGMFVGYNGFGFLADHIGRRRTIIITLLGVAAVMPIYAITSNHNALLWLGPLFGLFTAFFGLFGSYLSELFPTRGTLHRRRLLLQCRAGNSRDVAVPARGNLGCHWLQWRPDRMRLLLCLGCRRCTRSTQERCACRSD